MFVRIDQRRQRHRAFQRRIKLDAKFAHEIEIRPEASSDDELVCDHLTAATGGAGADREATAVGGEMRHAEFALYPDLAGGDQCGERRAQFAAGGELVVCPAAERLGRIVAAQQPDRLGLRRLRRELGEIGEGANRGMSRAQHRDGFAGIARAVFSEHVGHPVGDPVRRLRFADGVEAVGAGRVWRMPGAGDVDDGIGADDFRALPVLIADFEGCGFAASGLELVEADAADIGDTA